MTVIYVNHDWHKLPPKSDSLVPVQIYGREGYRKSGISIIGSPVIDKIKRFGIQLSDEVFDFMTIALSVISADTFVSRYSTADSWTREIELHISVNNKAIWDSVSAALSDLMRFLTGDIWKIVFETGGMSAPIPYLKNSRYRLHDLTERNVVSLYSGGLDSTIGALNLLADGFNPILVSHGYRGDSSCQKSVVQWLKGDLLHLTLNASPQIAEGKTDVSMRSRSIGFIAFGILAMDALRRNNVEYKEVLHIPENGFISLNAPLTPRRLGSLSTRTTHSHFLTMIQDILNQVGINVALLNPYAFLTKGEMIRNCQNTALLTKIISKTVSCGHWKRKNIQCGYCVPCIIRRAAIYASGEKDSTPYYYTKLGGAISDKSAKIDLFALIEAILRLEDKRPQTWALESGPLPAGRIDEYASVFQRGLLEVKNYLNYQKVI